jgi:hypothetical protein
MTLLNNLKFNDTKDFIKSSKLIFMEHPTSRLNSQITDASSLIVAKAAHPETTLYRDPRPEVPDQSKWVYLGVGLGTGVVVGAAIYY